MTPVKLKPDELAAFKEAFDMFDRNGDGSISTKVELCASDGSKLFSSGAARCNETGRSKPNGSRGDLVGWFL